MRQANRLRPLQMRVPRHQKVEVPIGLVDQDLQQRVDVRDDGRAGLSGPEPHVRCDLVISASAGVQPSAGVADRVRQRRLDVHVDVFFAFVPVELTPFDRGADRFEATDDFVGVLLG